MCGCWGNVCYFGVKKYSEVGTCGHVGVCFGPMEVSENSKVYVRWQVYARAFEWYIVILVCPDG